MQNARQAFKSQEMGKGSEKEQPARLEKKQILIHRFTPHTCSYLLSLKLPSALQEEGKLAQSCYMFLLFCLHHNQKHLCFISLL